MGSTSERQKARGAPSGASRIESLSRMELSICSVTCEETTRELGGDEMVLTAIETVPVPRLVDGRKTVQVKSRRAKTIDLGKFKKGEQRRFPEGRPLAAFSLPSRQAHWPCKYLATLMLVEEDQGRVEAVIAAVIDAVDKEVEQFVSAQAGTMATMAAGAALGSCLPFVGTVAGALAGAAAGAALSAIKNAQHDDPLRPKPVELLLHGYPDKAGTLPESQKTVRIEGQGAIYTIAYRLEIF